MFPPEGSRHRLSSDGYCFPLFCLRGFQDGICHVLGGQAIAECWSRGTVAVERKNKIRDLVNERMFVPNLEAWNPPVLHVWMIAIGNVNALPAAQLALIAIVKVIEPVQVMEIPRSGRALAVDFQREEGFVPAGVPCSFKQGEGTIFKPAKKCACIVYR